MKNKDNEIIHIILSKGDYEHLKERYMDEAKEDIKIMGVKQ